jgi:23S rRNA (cytosine1962-C5)-methyltransferase
MPHVALDSRAAARWRRGHPWAYADSLTSARDAEPGDVVSVEDAAGRSLGQAFYNPRSKIALRRITRGQEPVDASFWRARLRAALDRRSALRGEGVAFRWSHGEPDGLPGLILDVYDRSLVLQTLSFGADRLKSTWVDLCREILDPERIIARNDPSVRALEGLEPGREILHGEGTEAQVREGDLRFIADLWEGQKTGLFLDQRDNHRRLRDLARGRCLDVFTYQGGFALNLASRAESVLAADTSAPALERAASSARLNGLEGKVTFECENAFDLLARLDRAGDRFETIVVDPPAFARSRSDVPAAVRGYAELNRRAARLLAPGGILLTCSCSYNLGEEEFVEVVRQAAGEAHRSLRVLERRGQPADHPVLLEMPESAYLKGLLLQAEE